MLPTQVLRTLLLTSVTLGSPLHQSLQSHILTVAHQQLGILTIAFDTSSKDTPLHTLRTTAAGVRPNWLCGAGDNLYAVSRTGYPDAEAASGGVFAFEKSCATRNLKAIG